MSGTLVITDGTVRIDLLNLFHLVDWTPATPPIKGDGTWVSSPFLQGRQQVIREYDNVIDTFSLIAKSQQSIDDLIRNTQELRRLLEKAASYWLAEWQNEPVWIETRGICETNARYAIIHDYRAPNDDNPFAPPVTTSALFDSFTLVIEHGIWQDVAPTESNCLEIAAYSQNWCFPHYLDFDGVDDEVDCGSDASIDDLPSGGDFAIDGWIKADSFGEGNAGRIFDKVGWVFLINSGTGLYAEADYDVTNAISSSGLDDFSIDNIWHHVAAVWDSVAKTWSLYIDGVEPSYVLQQAGANNYVSDAASSLLIGNNAGGNATFDGKIGWLRLSSNQRFTADFDAAIPPRCQIPDPDAVTLAIWIYEGQGATADNREGTAALDGTITGATWGCDCECD